MSKTTIELCHELRKAVETIERENRKRYHTGIDFAAMAPLAHRFNSSDFEIERRREMRRRNFQLTHGFDDARLVVVEYWLDIIGATYDDYDVLIARNSSLLVNKSFSQTLEIIFPDKLPPLIQFKNRVRDFVYKPIWLYYDFIHWMKGGMS